MTEKELIELGFEKQFSLDSIGEKPEFYYYTKDFTNGLTFITNASDELLDGEWYIEFFNTEIPVRYCEYEKVKSLFELIEDGFIKK